jgi:hypothetical protein
MTSHPGGVPSGGGNPLVQLRIDEFGDLERVYELKFGLVFYVDYPPGPRRSAAVLDLYLRRYGSRVKRFMPTTPGSMPQEWTPTAHVRLMREWFPDLRRGIHWGYGFDDGKITDSCLFMFHGYRPHRQKGTASFFRFEFPWDVDQTEVRDFAVEVADAIPFCSGSAGYFLQVKPSIAEGYDAMYALCQRYWGVEAWNLDVTVRHVLHGYKVVNWLTLIGAAVANAAPDAMVHARNAAFGVVDTAHGTLFQAAERAVLGDRNRREAMPGYVALARALRPLQLASHGSFGGQRWDEANSLAWIRRFTDSAGP